MTINMVILNKYPVNPRSEQLSTPTNYSDLTYDDGFVGNWISKVKSKNLTFQGYKPISTQIMSFIGLQHSVTFSIGNTEYMTMAINTSKEQFFVNKQPVSREDFLADLILTVKIYGQTFDDIKEFDVE